MSAVVSTPATTIPNAGVPVRDSRANRAGHSPSLASATGSWPTLRIQPLSAPKHDIDAPSATAADAPFPSAARAASANGAVDIASDEGGTRLITPMVLTM